MAKSAVELCGVVLYKKKRLLYNSPYKWAQLSAAVECFSFFELRIWRGQVTKAVIVLMVVVVVIRLAMKACFAFKRLACLLLQIIHYG